MSVAGLKKMMHIWKSRNITDSTTTKLLELYLGLTAYMNSQKIYPQENFYEIRNSLRFSTTQALIEAMKRSQAFPFVTDPETGAVKAFWSPLYHETNSEIHTEKDNGLSSQTFAQTFAQTFVATDNNNNINNNIFIYYQYRFFSLFVILYCLKIKPPYTPACANQDPKLKNRYTTP